MGFTYISSTVRRWKYVMASPFLSCFGLSSSGGGGGGGGAGGLAMRHRCNSDDGLTDMDLAAAAARTITTHAQQMTPPPSSPIDRDHHMQVMVSTGGQDEVGVPYNVAVSKQQQAVFFLNALTAAAVRLQQQQQNPEGVIFSSASNSAVMNVSPPSSQTSNHQESSSSSSSPVQSAPSSQRSSNSVTFSSARDDLEESERRNSGEYRLRQLGVLLNNPVRPEYAQYEARLGSFMGAATWPSDFCGPTFEKLAEAGLYYMGKRDCVKCFFCDGRLRRWAANDDAWIEHARWYPDCAFVHNVKGRHFIESVLGQEKTRSAYTASRSATASSSSGDETSNSIISQNSAESSCAAVGGSCASQTRSVNSAGEPTPTCDRAAAAGEGVGNVNTAEEARPPPVAAPVTPACKICLDRDVCIAFLPCGHLSACAQCAPALQHCPICRTQILSTVRTYLV